MEMKASAKCKNYSILKDVVTNEKSLFWSAETSADY